MTGLCVCMNAPLPTSAHMKWEPQKDSVSESGPQPKLTSSQSNSSFTDNLERAMVVLSKELDGSKYPIFTHAPCT